jgi:UDP-glucose 4-epimerase
MKILLTGATGFLGSKILSELVKKYGSEHIVALSSFKIPEIETAVYKNRKEFSLAEYDFKEIEVIVHAGAFTPKSREEADNIKLSNSNVLYTDELLSLPFPNLSKIINISSLDVYGDDLVLTELSKVEPCSLYGASKYYCEELVLAYSRNKNIESLILRVGHVYGPGEEQYDKVLPLAIKNILSSKAVEIWGDGSDIRSFIYIDDVVSAIVSSVEIIVKEKIINLVSGNSMSIFDLICKLYEVSGQPKNIVKIESNHAVRNIINDNSILMSTLLEEEKSIIDGLRIEYEYMKGLYENNI